MKPLRSLPERVSTQLYKALATYVLSVSRSHDALSESSTQITVKVAMPEDITSQVVVLFSSTVSGDVTGQVIKVEGGMEGRLLNRPEDFAV